LFFILILIFNFHFHFDSYFFDKKNMNYSITSLHTYPIKSLSGVSLKRTLLSNQGLRYDRYWMLIDEDGVAYTQRDNPLLALFEIELSSNGVVVKYKEESISIPFKKTTQNEKTAVKLWKNDLIALKELDVFSEWFSDLLSKKLFLVRPDTDNIRLTNNHPDAIVNFPDSNQFLILGENAMKQLNEKMDTPLDINRFRSNITFSGGTPHIEDEWTQFSIGNALFEMTKPCARCSMTTINQTTADKGLEPIRSLVKYRRLNNAICFGSYAKLLKGEGVTISVGDKISIKNTD